MINLSWVRTNGLLPAARRYGSFVVVLLIDLWQPLKPDKDSIRTMVYGYSFLDPQVSKDRGSWIIVVAFDTDGALLPPFGLSHSGL